MEYLSYPDLRKEEFYLISRAEYEKRKLITTEFSRKLFPDPLTAAAVLASLSRKGRLIKIQRGKYFLVPVKAPNQQWLPNEFVAAKYWIGDFPYYIGYFAMYHYWGFTEQMPQTFHILNAKKNAEMIIGHTAFKAVKVSISRIYGYQEIEIEGEKVQVSDRERTFVDYFHRPIGSVEEFHQTLKRALTKIDLDKLIRYLNEFPIKSLRRRAGFYLDEHGLDRAHLEDLRAHLGNPTSYVVLDPSRKTRKGAVNKRWGVIVN